jgi:hypothetical protein
MLLIAPANFGLAPRERWRPWRGYHYCDPLSDARCLAKVGLKMDWITSKGVVEAGID